MGCTHCKYHHLSSVITQFLHFLRTQWLKITEKVAFNIASEASYVYILSGQKFIKNAKNGQFWRFFENATFLVIFKHCERGGFDAWSRCRKAGWEVNFIYCRAPTRSNWQFKNSWLNWHKNHSNNKWLVVCVVIKWHLIPFLTLLTKKSSKWLDFP